MIAGFNTQDTIKPRLVVRINTERLPDSVFRKLDERSVRLKSTDYGKVKKTLNALPAENLMQDTVSVCSRNPIADVTYFDSLSFVRNSGKNLSGNLPFKLSERKESSHRGYSAILTKNLKDGKELAPALFHHDWITVVIVISVWLFLIVRTATRNLLSEVLRFFLFRGINEPASRDIGSLFYWQSTVLNFISFLVLGLFAFLASEWLGFTTDGIFPVFTMLIFFGIISTGITLRHVICTVTGNLSGEQEAFNEYLLNVYQSYRFSSVLIFCIVVLLLFTVFSTPGVWISTGFIILGIFYFYRVLRLLLIFIKRDISILYLILYLCALEILPVLILLKYFTGLE